MSALRLDRRAFYLCAEAPKTLLRAVAPRSPACQVLHRRSLAVSVQAAAQPFTNTRRRMTKGGKPPAYFANDLSIARLADSDLAEKFRNAVYRTTQVKIAAFAVKLHMHCRHDKNQNPGSKTNP